MDLGVTSSTKAMDNLIVYNVHPPVIQKRTIVSGAGELEKGTVLGRQTSGGAYISYDDDGTDDGRRVAVAILAEDIDATSEAVVADVILHGAVREEELTGLDTAGELDLQVVGIYVVPA